VKEFTGGKIPFTLNKLRFRMVTARINTITWTLNHDEVHVFPTFTDFVRHRECPLKNYWIQLVLDRKPLA
jgi:hypothetical protein